MPWFFYSPDGTQRTDTVSESLPPGTIISFVTDDAGAPIVPSGWLLCDGDDHLIAAFPALFAAIGTAFDSPAPTAGEFRVPDMEDRFAFGATVASSPVGEASAGGSETHIHAGISHTHDINVDHTHTAPDHQHNYSTHRHTTTAHSHGNGTLSVAVDGSETADTTAPTFSMSLATHIHTVSGSSATVAPELQTNASTIALGLGGAATTDGPTLLTTTDAAEAIPDAESHLPPFLNVYFIIKT